MTSPSGASRRARLAWRCRRGMRELDLLLAQFLERGLDSLDSGELAAFERLLEAPDQDILAWLCGTRDPQAPDLARAVRAMRAHIAPPGDRLG